MDFDLDIFDSKRHRRDGRSRRHRDDDRDDDHDGRRRRGHARTAGGWSRRAHPHVFAWLLLGGGVVLLGLALIAIASSLGLWGHVADAYMAASRALLPASWHEAWMALPGVAHVAIGLAALFVLAGLAGELLD